MSLAASLQSILNEVEDAEGVALVGMDGMVVNEAKRSPGVDLSMLAAEYCGLWREMARVSGGLSLGMTEECSISSEHRTVLFRRVTPEYFLAMSMPPSGNTGKGRYFLRYAVPRLAGDL